MTSIIRIKIQDYLSRHYDEFPNEGAFFKLPLPTDALSVVEAPQNWTCFPENIVRIYLAPFENFRVIGVGDYQYPTVCSKVFETLDEACAWIAYRPERLSRQWLEAERFKFNPIKTIKFK